MVRLKRKMVGEPHDVTLPKIDSIDGLKPMYTRNRATLSQKQQQRNRAQAAKAPPYHNFILENFTTDGNLRPAITHPSAARAERAAAASASNCRSAHAMQTSAAFALESGSCDR